MANFTKIGTSMLHMDDIVDYLRAKNFAKKTDTVEDVKTIGGIEAARIAEAYDKTDRTTVRNSRLFDGHSVKDFVLAEKGNGLTAVTELIKETYNQEIEALRDEVYQLRMELAKKGYVNRYDGYAGFYDVFRTSNPAHQKGIIAIAAKDSRPDAARSTIKLLDNDFSKFIKGDHIFMTSKSTGKSQIVEIVECMPDKETIRFTPETPFAITKDDVAVYKSKGSLINNTFVFGEMVPVRPGTKELYSSLDDDTHWSTKKLNKKNEGFAYTFRIPNAYQKNYLARIQIKVKKYGQPGALKCYVINEKDRTRYKNPTDAREKGFLIAESKPLIVDPKMDLHLEEFIFFDPKEKKENYLRDSIETEVSAEQDAAKRVLIEANPNNYPLLKDSDNAKTSNTKVRYCMIIVAQGETNEDNYHEIVFLGNSEEPSKDLQLNNTTFTFKEQTTSSIDQAFETNEEINNCDLYYGVTLLEAIKQKFTPFTEGIYNANIKTNNKLASKIRLTMRINREGMFNITSDAGVPGFGDFGNGATIAIKGEDSFDVNGFFSFEKKKIAIGTNIRELTAVSGNSLTVKTGLHIEPNDIIYPIGYTVSVKAKRTEWDDEACRTVTKEVAKYEVPLCEILRDGFKDDETLSDRLIFEKTFKDDDGNAKEYNEFEIEIHWEKTCKELNSKMVGSIHDLVVTFDKAI